MVAVTSPDSKTSAKNCWLEPAICWRLAMLTPTNTQRTRTEIVKFSVDRSEFMPPCRLRPPVLSDHIYLVAWVVVIYRFYCTFDCTAAMNLSDACRGPHSESLVKRRAVAISSHCIHLHARAPPVIVPGWVCKWMCFSGPACSIFQCSGKMFLFTFVQCMCPKKNCILTFPTGNPGLGMSH